MYVLENPKCSTFAGSAAPNVQWAVTICNKKGEFSSFLSIYLKPNITTIHAFKINTEIKVVSFLYSVGPFRPSGGLKMK